MTWRSGTGVAAAICGAFLATLNTRTSAFALADIRASLGLSFDQGAWLNTAYIASEVAVIPLAVFFLRIISLRRFVAGNIAIFGLTSLWIANAHDYAWLLVLIIVHGWAGGVLIPAAMLTTLRCWPLRSRTYGLACYGLAILFTANVSSSVDGWYTEHLDWRWIYLQHLPIALTGTLGALYGLPHEPAHPELLRRGDWAGMVFLGAGLAAILTGLDQGNRLDWFSSGLIVALLGGGSASVMLFLVHHASTREPLLDLSLLRRRNVLLGALILIVLRFALLAEAFVTPQYLSTVQGFRTLQLGPVLLWVAVPQLLFLPLAAELARRLDARAITGGGLLLIAAGSLLSARLTSAWAGEDFEIPLLLQAAGLPFALVGLLTAVTSSVSPPEGALVGALTNTARAFGATLGVNLVATLVTQSERVQSYLLGLHVTAVLPSLLEHLSLFQVLASTLTASDDTATRIAIALSDAAVRREAQVLAYRTAYAAIGVLVVLGALLCALMRYTPPPGRTSA